MEWVRADSHVKGVLAYILDEVLVSTDTCSLKGFSGELFVLIRDQMDAQRELVYASLLASQIIDTDLGVWYTPAET